MKRIIAIIIACASLSYGQSNVPITFTTVNGINYPNVTLQNSGGIWYAVYSQSTPAPQAWQIPAGSVLWWKMSEPTNAQGLVNDYSTIGTNHGIASNIVWVAGSNGICASYFFNSAVANDSISKHAWTYNDATSNMTWMFWAKHDLAVVTANQFVWTKNGTTLGAGFGGSAPQIGASYLDLTSGSYFTLSHPSVDRYPWYLYAMTYNGAQGCKLWRNGVLLASNTTLGTIDITSGTFHMGNLEGQNQGTYGFNGWASDMMIFTNALTQAQILDVFTNQISTHGWSNSLALSNPSLYSNVVCEILGEYNYPASTDPTTNQAHMTSYSGANAYDPAWRANGTNGWWEFDGVNDYLSNNNQYLYTNQPWTVSAWFFADSYGGGGGYPEILTLNTHIDENWKIGITADGNYSNIYFGANTAYYRGRIGLSTPPTGRWINVSIVYDGVERTASSSFTAYINGTQTAFNNVGGFDAGAGQPNYIGRESSYYFDGIIDDARIATNAFTSNQVYTIYNTTKGKYGL